MPVIPSIQMVEIGRVAVQGQPKQKIRETPSQQISQAWWCTLVVLATGWQKSPGLRLALGKV
jgi:hypothetical protein